MSNLIEAGDGLVDAIAGGNTGVTQKAIDAWDAAKAEYVEENGVDDAAVEDEGEPGVDPDAGEQGENASAPVNPS